MRIAKHTVVTLEYTLQDDQGNTLDTSDGGDPLIYLHGADKMIPGLEKAIEGREAGESLKTVITPDDAYGDHHDSLVQQVDAGQFEASELEVGAQFLGETEVGDVLFTIVDIDGADVTVDGNHPLAGFDLHFDLTIREVREATAEEIERGFAEGQEEDDGGL